MQTIDFFVPGVPATAGSKKPFLYRGKDGKQHASMAPDNKRQRPWMEKVSSIALQTKTFEGVMTGPIRCHITYILIRPKSHYGTGRNVDIVKPHAPKYPTVKPDHGKLTRAIEDALTGIIWRDDSQVVQHSAEKVYGSTAGACIVIQEITLEDVK